MPRLLRLDEIRKRSQRRANKEGDGDTATPEWNALISEQYAELYAEVEKTGMRFSESTYSITATGAASYALPSDHLATIGLDRITDTAGTRCELDEIMPQERTIWAGSTGDAVAYAVIDDAIYLYPKPASGNYELLYIAQAPDLSTGGDSTQVDVFNGDGEAFLIWGTAVKAMSKGEADVSLAIAEREAARGRLIDWATMRAFTQPRRPIVRRTASDFYGDPYDLDYSGPGGWRWGR